MKKFALFLLTTVFISSVSTGFACQVLEKKLDSEDYGCGCGKKKKKGK